MPRSGLGSIAPPPTRPARPQSTVPKGTYDLVVWKVGYDVPILSTEVAADWPVELEAAIVPEEDPDAIWQT